MKEISFMFFSLFLCIVPYIIQQFIDNTNKAKSTKKKKKKFIKQTEETLKKRKKEMADDCFTKPQYKTRSASISAPASSSLEAIVNTQCEIDSPEGGTPYRRRKPATRSQSARIPSGRAVCILLYSEKSN